MTNDELAVLTAALKRRYEKTGPTKLQLELAERAIALSEGRTPEREELLRFWYKLVKEIG